MLLRFETGARQRRLGLKMEANFPVKLGKGRPNEMSQRIFKVSPQTQSSMFLAGRGRLRGLGMCRLMFRKGRPPKSRPNGAIQILLLLLEMRPVERGICPIATSTSIMNELFQ